MLWFTQNKTNTKELIRIGEDADFYEARVREFIKAKLMYLGDVLLNLSEKRVKTALTPAETRKLDAVNKQIATCNTALDKVNKMHELAYRLSERNKYEPETLMQIFCDVRDYYQSYDRLHHLDYGLNPIPKGQARAIAQETKTIHIKLEKIQRRMAQVFAE